MWKLLLQAWRKGPACQFEFASRYTRLYPDHAEGWMVLADGLAGTARYREARVALQKAGRLTPRDRRWFIAVQWGLLYREKHDEQRAERWFRKAVALYACTSTHILLGATLAKQGRFAEAKQNHRRAIELACNPDKDAPDEAYHNLGLILRAERKYREAAMYFKKAIRLDPRYTSAHEALGDVEEATRLRRT